MVLNRREFILETIENVTTKIGASTGHDQNIWDQTIDSIKKSEIGTRDIIEDAILFQRRVNFAKQ